MDKITNTVNIFLDDDKQFRITPKGFLRFYTGESLIEFLENNNVKINIISFDNDLGLNILEGYDVVKYMMNNGISANQYNIHSANTVAVLNMKSYINSAYKASIIPSNNITIWNNKELIKRCD